MRQKAERRNSSAHPSRVRRAHQQYAPLEFKRSMLRLRASVCPSHCLAASFTVSFSKFGMTHV